MTTSEINFSPFGSQFYYEALDDILVLQKLYHPLFSHKTNLLAYAMQIGEYVYQVHTICKFLIIVAPVHMCGCVKRSLKCILSPEADSFTIKYPLVIYTHIWTV